MESHCFLVIGSTGFIGSNICSKIRKKNSNLYTVSRSKDLFFTSSSHFIVDLLEPGSIKSVIEQLKTKYKEISIYYLAGLTWVQESLDEASVDIAPIINSYVEMIDSLKDCKSSIVFASSGSVYDGIKNEYCDESSALKPISPYSLVKHSCEVISFRSCELFNIDIKIARIFSVYGENMGRFFIFDIVRKLLMENKRIILSGDGNQVRDYLYVDNVSEGLIFLMKNGIAGEVYNLCSGVPIVLNELALIIRDILGKNSIDIIWDNKTSLGSHNRWYGNPSKIANIGFQPTLDFEVNLEKTVNSIKNRILTQS